MAWDEVRLSRFQERQGTSWWAVLLAFVLGGGGGFMVGQWSNEPPPEEPQAEPSTTVVSKTGPVAPRDPLLAALHASSPVKTCFAKHGSRKDADKHEVIRLALVIEPDGSVNSASVTVPGRPSLQSCLMTALGDTRFPTQRHQRDVGLSTEMGSWFR